MTANSNPVLYVFGPSVWAKVPELALIELGYPQDAVEKKSVDLAEAENLSPEFIKISKPGTLPVLVVDGKAYTSTIDVTRYLLEHAPKPATPGKHQVLIDALHEDGIDPNFPFIGARSVAELEAKKASFPGTFVRQRYQAVCKFNREADDDLKAYYKPKLQTIWYLNCIYNDAPAAEVDAFINKSVGHWQGIHFFILRTLFDYLPESGFVESPENPGEADFHLAAWLARIALLCGSGNTAMGKEMLEKELGQKLPERVATYWDAWAGRESWGRVYADGLH